jgi:hypothetical protein
MTKHNLFGRILFLFFILSGCNSASIFKASPTLALPNSFTQIYEQLNSNSADSLVETVMLDSSSQSSPLFKVGYISEDNSVVGVYEGGKLIGWNTDKATVAFVHEIGIVSSKALSFTPSSAYLIGATQHISKPNRYDQDVEYVNGIGVWDVRTGTLIRCITFPCQNTSGSSDGFYLGLAVDSEEKRLAVYSEIGAVFSSLLDDSPRAYVEFNALDSQYHWQAGSVLFDPSGQRYIVVFQEGRIHSYNNERSKTYRVIEDGLEGDGVIITDAQIDPTGRWLVVARGDKTQVLNLDNGEPLLEIVVSNPVLTFDRTGELLFIGSANKMIIYSIEETEKIAEYDAVGITSLFISQDNRLVIWGDMQGVIHVWARVAQ